MERKGQVIYISHGGGPLPILGDASHESMVKFMKTLPSKLHKPKAIVVFSAHWEEDIIKVQSNIQPDLIYDYYGFPEVSYQLKYNSKGQPELAKEITETLIESGVSCELSKDRPYDHGSYIPLMLMYPEADIPVIQVSLSHSLKAQTHYNIGKALQPLMSRNILWIGSGFSFHNMRAFDFSGTNTIDQKNDAFQNALIEICCHGSFTPHKAQALLQWDQLEGARYCHPREEHLLPLHICVGLAESRGEIIFDDYIIGKRAVAFKW